MKNKTSINHENGNDANVGRIGEEAVLKLRSSTNVQQPIKELK